MKLGLVLTAAMLMTGCEWCTVKTDTSIVHTGLFGNNLNLLSDKVEELEKIYESKKPTTLEDVENLGWKLKFKHRTPNVEQLPGADAFQRIYPNAFQGRLANADNEEPLSKEMQRYKAFFIPLRQIWTYEDRYYWSTKETIKQGDDLMIVIMFRDNKLFYVSFKPLRIDTKDSTSAFAQGLLEVIKEYLGPAAAINDLYNKLKTTIKP